MIHGDADVGRCCRLPRAAGLVAAAMRTRFYSLDPRMITRTMLLAACLVINSACAREPEMTSLTAVTYNYGSEAISRVLVNGKWAGSSTDEVEPGDATGGGSICCVSVPYGAESAEVEILFGDGWYKTEATIEQPWPPQGWAHYLNIHVLPERKVVLAVTVSRSRSRKDLLMARLEELGVKEYEIRDPHLWLDGPEQINNRD